MTNCVFAQYTRKSGKNTKQKKSIKNRELSVRIRGIHIDLHLVTILGPPATIGFYTIMLLHQISLAC